jgi:hypothetical protein
VFRLLSLLAAFGILVLCEGPAGRALARPSADPVDAPMTQADRAPRHAVAGLHASYPAWLPLPPGTHIINGIVIDITPTQIGGFLAIAVSGDGPAQVTAWETRLRAAGFTIQDGGFADLTGCTLGIEAMLRAEQPATGRGLRLTLSSDGIMLSFWEPYSGRP